MDEPLDTTNGWVGLPLPEAAEVPRDRIALALRYAMHLAARSRRGAELGSATLGSVAHLLGADAGLLARTDKASIAAEALAALARGTRSGGPSGGAGASGSAEASAAEPWRRPRRSMRKILAEPLPRNDAKHEESSSANLNDGSDGDEGDSLLLFGWRIVAIRPDSAMADAALLDLRPTLAPTLAQLTRQLLHEAMRAHGAFAMRDASSALAGAPASYALQGPPATADGRALLSDRLLRVGADVVVSIVGRNSADASRSFPFRPAVASPAGASDDESEDPNREPDLDANLIAGDLTPRDAESEPDVHPSGAASTTGETSVGGHVSQLAVDSAALRAAVIAGTTEEFDTVTKVPGQPAASSGDGAATPAAGGISTARPVVWSLLALHGVATDPGTLAVMQAFHRAAVDAGLLVDDRPDLLASLSRGERETVQLLLTGKSELAIASLLRRSPHTIHSHVKRAYRKLGVASRAELMAKLLPG